MNKKNYNHHQYFPYIIIVLFSFLFLWRAFIHPETGNFLHLKTGPIWNINEYESFIFKFSIYGIMIQSFLYYQIHKIVYKTIETSEVCWNDVFMGIIIYLSILGTLIFQIESSKTIIEFHESILAGFFLFILPISYLQLLVKNLLKKVFKSS